MKPSIQIQELGHIVFYVRNIERSATFYRDVLGWQQLPLPKDLPAAAFSSGRTHHELLLIEVGEHTIPPHGQRPGFYHMGLKIGDSDDDLREALTVLQSAHVPLIGATDHTVTHSLYITDPDGNEIELYIDVPGVDWQAHPELIGSPPRRLDL